jgi:hypothetical protein
MRKGILAAFAIFILFSGFLTGCTSGVGSSDKPRDEAETKSQAKESEPIYPQKEGKPVLLFDLAHREVFSPDDESPRGQKMIYSLFSSLGYEVVRNEEMFTPEVLSSSHTVYIPGAMSMLSEEEIKNLKEFVKNGGCLIATVHVNFFMQPLLESFGFQITNSPICQSEKTFHGNLKDFLATSIIEHDVTQGISGVAVMGTWGIREADKDAKVVVSTSDNAWADINGNDAFDNSDIRGKFGIIGVYESGKGKVVIAADDAVFSNALLGNEGNKKLVENIVRWFLGETGKGVI